ncbi:MAG TPA: hypothetical protein PKW56_06800 [Clostridiales bacterium]|nr:hypothetical protein [Clostridiales bacterium]
MAEENSETGWKQKTDELIGSFTGSDHKLGKCPGSRKEINNAKKLIEELRVESLKDDDLKKELDDIQKRIKVSQKLRYVGSYWIPLLVGAFIIFFFYNMGLKQFFTDLEVGSIETVQKVLDSEVTDTSQELNRAKTRYDNYMMRGKEEKAKKVKLAIDKLEKKLEEFKAMTPESYIEYRKQKWDDEGVKGVKFWGSKFIMFVLLVFFSFIPAYELNRRGGIDGETSGIMSFIGRLFDALITMQPRIVTSDDGYGNKLTSTDDAGSLLAFILPLVIMLIVIMVIVFYLLPYMLILAFLRNYLIPKFY